jgi:hypothetical protein
MITRISFAACAVSLTLLCSGAAHAATNPDVDAALDRGTQCIDRAVDATLSRTRDDSTYAGMLAVSLCMPRLDVELSRLATKRNHNVAYFSTKDLERMVRTYALARFEQLK